MSRHLQEIAMIKNQMEVKLEQLATKQQQVQQQNQELNKRAITIIEKIIAKDPVMKEYQKDPLVSIEIDHSNCTSTRTTKISWYVTITFREGECYDFIQNPALQLSAIETDTSGRIDDTYVTLKLQYTIKF